MRTLIVGAGALGGVIAARAIAAGLDVAVASRRPLGELRVTGIGGEVKVAVNTAPLEEQRGPFELIVLATKAQEALEVALPAEGVVLPIQNGAVSVLLRQKLGERVIGGLSNLGATMHAPGVYEQRNAGHLLIGELHGGPSARVDAIARHLGQAIAMRTTENMRGAIWSKLLLNCSVTTLGALAGVPMRQYIAHARDVFFATYDETLAVARASGATPERMIVEPVPPPDREPWLSEVLAAYGDLKPSMLQDFERGRRTEINFINGYVAEQGRALGVPAPINAAITALVHRIERGELKPSPALLDDSAFRAR